MKTLKEVGLDNRNRRIYQFYKKQETISELGEKRESTGIRQGVRAELSAPAYHMTC